MFFGVAFIFSLYIILDGVPVYYGLILACVSFLVFHYCLFFEMKTLSFMYLKSEYAEFCVLVEPHYIFLPVTCYVVGTLMITRVVS